MSAVHRMKATRDAGPDLSNTLLREAALAVLTAEGGERAQALIAQLEALQRQLAERGGI
jgi:hypothetical protein